MPIHYFLRAARKQSGMSLREAASRTGISASTLYRYEEGLIRNIPPERVRLLMDFYHDYLMDYLSGLWERIVQERWSLYQNSRPLVTADYLLERYNRADEAGRQRFLAMLDLMSRPETDALMPAPPGNGSTI